MTASFVVLFGLGFGYLTVSLIFAARQERLFFQPKRALAATPDTAGLAHDEVTITVTDGTRLRAWWLPRTIALEGPAAQFTVLFLHGANANLGDRVDALRFWHDLGAATLAVDYRGYGHSEGRATEAGLYRDVRAAWRWLIDDHGLEADEIIVVAESMGVSLATSLGSDEQPAGLVLEAGFTCAADMAQRRYPWLPVRQMISLRLSNEDRIGQVRAPKLIVHSVEDQLVPVSMARKLHDRAAPPRQILTVRGAHARACVEGGPRYRKGLVRWLEGLPRPIG